MNTSHRLLVKRKGQSLVEFALILPVFCLLVFGTLEWSLYFFAKLSLDTAASSAARKAVTFTDWPGNQEERENEVKSEFMNIAGFIPSAVLPGIQDEENIVIDFEDNINSIQYIKVSTKILQYKTITGFGALYNVPTTLNAEARVCYEGY